MTNAFIFPGQGSQSVGMLDRLNDKFKSQCVEFFKEASGYAEFDIWNLIENGPQQQINQTEYTQVVMLASDVLIFRLYKQNFANIKPTVMAGHSLGEYAALVCSGAMTLEQGIKIVRRRGQLMQQSVPMGEGAMAAIVGLDDDVVDNICQTVSNDQINVSPANFNAPGQVVIAGHSKAVEQAILLANKKEARLAKLLPVSVPCHCQLLIDASKQFQSFLEQFEFKLPSIPVIANINSQPYDTTDCIIPWLTKQLFCPVLWVDSIECMVNSFSISSVLEMGPGNVLSGLVKRINRTIKPLSGYAELLSNQI